MSKNNDENKKAAKEDIRVYERALKNTQLDFDSADGRRKALAVIADMCINGYKVETVGGRSDKVIEITQKNPQAAIRAITEIQKLAPNVESKFEVNFKPCTPPAQEPNTQTAE